MLSIGLTGGIASGKSTVSRLFAALDAPIVDTDIISHALLEPNRAGYQKVVERYSEAILQKNRQIDRRQLRQIVFGNPADKQWLEALLHPMIYRETELQIEYLNDANYVIVVIPLLFETSFQSLVNRVLAIDCSADTQTRRLQNRDGIDLKLARQMLDQQWSNEARLALADDIINNDSDSKSSLEQQVVQLHEKYQLLAGADDKA